MKLQVVFYNIVLPENLNYWSKDQKFFPLKLQKFHLLNQKTQQHYQYMMKNQMFHPPRIDPGVITSPITVIDVGFGYKDLISLVVVFVFMLLNSPTTLPKVS